MDEPIRLGPNALRELFLFESLDDEQLAWLSEHGRLEDRRQGDTVFGEGQPATCFFVLLAGTISMHRQVENTDERCSADGHGEPLGGHRGGRRLTPRRDGRAGRHSR